MMFERQVRAVASIAAVAVGLAAPSLLAPALVAQMHKVAKPDQVTRAIGVYEYVGDITKPRAARLIPISLFIGGHFEDAAVYLARPIPFALDTGLRYELMEAGVRKQFLDLVAARNFAGSSAAAAAAFDDGWFGYGRVLPLPTVKSAKLRPNCGNAHVVQESGSASSDRPHFGSKSVDTVPDAKPADTSATDTKPADTATPGARPADSTGDARPSFKTAAKADPKTDSKADPCRTSDDDDRPERIAFEDTPKDKNSPDPERPTLHRSPETTANNTGANGKPDKKAAKPPAAVITANGSPADDPDRPTIRHREAADDDPNALPPDPVDLASRDAAAKVAAKSTGAAASPGGAASPAATAAGTATGSNDTVAEEGTITAGNTMGGGPVLRRGKLTQPKDDDTTTSAPASAKAAAPVSTGASTSATVGAPASSRVVAAKPGVKTLGKPAFAAPATATAPIPPSVIAPALDSMVAVSDAKERPAHDYSYHFASGLERASALQSLEAMAQAVLEKPSLASDAGEISGTHKSETSAKPAPVARPAVAHPAAPSTPASRARAKAAAAAAAAAASAGPVLADEQMSAFQLYYSAPISYTFTARTPATATAPERYVVVVATTDAEGKIAVSFRSVTDSAHLDRIPRYRLIDAVDADGSNRAELLMELRAQHTRQFALYRLLGNKPDQVFVSGSTLL